MHDAYVLARRVADLMRQVVPARVIDELLNEPEAMSYYVASNLPLQDSSRCVLIISFGRSLSDTFVNCEAEQFGFCSTCWLCRSNSPDPKLQALSGGSDPKHFSDRAKAGTEAAFHRLHQDNILHRQTSESHIYAPSPDNENKFVTRGVRDPCCSMLIAHVNARMSKFLDSDDTMPCTLTVTQGIGAGDMALGSLDEVSDWVRLKHSFDSDCRIE
jgi:hypothetical protein